MIIGIDHGYYAIKTRHCSFPAGLTCYGSHEPYTRQSVLEVDGQFYVCGTGRQPVRCDKTENDTYYLLTLAALAQEIKMRGAPNESSVKIAAGLPLTSFGRDKPKFRQYLLRSQPVLFRFEGTEYKIAVEDVALFPQGYAALLTDPDLLLDEPSLLLMDIGGWTVDLMRIDNARPVAETAHSLEFGMIRCIDAVREQVRRETGLSLTDAQIEQMLAGGPCALGDSVREIVRQQGRAYTERLFALVTEAGFDLRALPTVMLGGGAGIVQRHVGPKDGLATMRSRGIFCSIIAQNMAQLKAMYKNDWESLVGLCDEFLYLGGNEQGTHKYVSELIGKETISIASYNRSRGRNGSYSVNRQTSGRELLKPDEVRLLGDDKAILFVRGERPILDDKYDLLRHPNIRFTEDGGASPYDYTAAAGAANDLPGQPEQYELLDMDDFEDKPKVSAQQNLQTNLIYRNRR